MKGSYILASHKKQSSLSLSTSLALVALCSTFSLLNSSSAFAEDTTINITSTPAISLITSSNNITMNVEPTSAGSFQTTPLIITAGTNNPNGYTLYFSVVDNNTNLAGNNGNISTLDNDNNGAGYTPDSFVMNRWGYSIGTIASEDNDTTIYHPAPTISSPSIIDTYNAPINTRNTTINLATKVDLATASGSYSKQLVVSILPTIITYELSYDANTTDAVANLPSTTIAEQWSDVDPTFSIDTTKIPTRAGYNFQGYATTNGGTTAEYAYDATTGTFTPAAFTPSTTSSTLYAVWEKPKVTFDQAFANAGKSKATAKDGKQYYRMQDMTTSICSAVTAASSTAAADTQIGTLVDNRGDKKTYTVAKLLDGNCWMTENLRLGGSSAITLTSSDSEVSSNFTLPAHVSDWGAPTYTAAMIHVSDDIDTVTNQYYGYYYNYYAASAGTVTNSGTVNASASICPKGWTLPDNYTQTAGQSYSNLLHKYGVIANITDNQGYASDGYAKLTSAPLSFALSGLHNNSGTTVYNNGLAGNYWSGTSYSANYAYILAFNSSDVLFPQNYSDKRYGRVIRCVAQ